MSSEKMDTTTTTTTTTKSTEENKSDNQRDHTYFGYYAQLTNQQNMLQDSIRTGAYKWAITQNRQDFAGKVILDVGAGSGILSFFAVQAGAKKVYAVEASEMAKLAKMLVESNNLSNKIVVLEGKMEEIQLPEPVDIIISEPMGVLLVHERMIETFVYARTKFLKPNGKMFPGRSDIFLSPFTDQFLYTETMSKARFWQQNDFYGVDLNGLFATSIRHHFSQPIVGCFDPRSLMSQNISHSIDFESISLSQLQNFEIPFSFVSNYTGIIHGLAGWFDVFFDGSEVRSSLTTSPYAPKTHWYQIRFMLINPIAINVGQVLSGKMILDANENRSYNIKINLVLEGTNISVSQDYNLHEQQYYYPNLPDPTVSSNPETNSLYSIF